MADETILTRFTASDDVSPVVKAIGNSVERLNRGLTAVNKVGSLVGIATGFATVTAISATMTSAITRAVATYESLHQQELKLVTIMRQRMGANREMIGSINQLISAQTRLGVVGGGAQRAGAQQLATFLSSTDSLRTLIPAMNNLAVQQNGVNVSAEAMVGIGNLMGKVMQGQTAALRRVGITFTEAEENALKFGTEEERAAVLAQVITNNVGKMNEVFGQTPEGQKVQAANRLAGAYANLGAKIDGVKNTVEASFSNMAADTLNNWADGIAFAFGFISSAVSMAVQGIYWFGSTVAQCIEILSPYIALLGIMYGAYSLVIFAVGAYNVVVNGAAASTKALSAVETVAVGLMYLKDGVMKIVAGTTAALKSGTVLATAAQWLHNAAVMAFPGMWLAAVIAIVIGVIAALAASTGNLQDVFSSVWGTIVDIVTGAINLIIDAINVFIGAMNKAASLSNKLFKTDFNPIATVEHVSGQGLKDAGNRFIYNGELPGFGVPKLETPPVMDAENGGTVTGDSNTPAIKDNTARTADATEKMATKLDMTEDEIKDLIAMSERSAISKWQNNTFEVHITNQNEINNDTDIDGMGTNVYEMLRQAVLQSKEGLVSI